MSRKPTFLLCLIVLVSAVSCSSDETPERDLRAMYEQVSIGMTRAKVNSTIGEPDSESLSGDENTIRHMIYQSGDYDILNITLRNDSVSHVSLMQPQPPGSIL